MEEKVEPQTESRDMAERVEEMLSAIDAASAELEEQDSDTPAALIDDLIDMSNSIRESADETAAVAASAEYPADDPPVGASPMSLDAEELTEADAEFVVNDLPLPGEADSPAPSQPAGEQAALDHAAEDQTDELLAESDAQTSLDALDEAVASLQTDTLEPGGEPDAESPDEPSPPASGSTAPDGTVGAQAEGAMSADDGPAAPDSLDAPAGIDELDAELASLADAMLEGSIEALDDPAFAADEMPSAEVGAPSTQPPPERAPTPADTADTAEPSERLAAEDTAATPTSAPADQADPPDPAVHSDETPPDRAPETSHTPANPPPSSATAKPSGSRQEVLLALAQRACGFLKPLASKVWRLTAPMLAGALLLISKPVEKLSPAKRDTIGWFAAYTAFLAICVWGFVLMFRKPATPQPTTDPINLLGDPPESGSELGS
ncbi:MAG: hypothetical protein Kow0022_17850 [Phycisphaerales bacterium]